MMLISFHFPMQLVKIVPTFLEKPVEEWNSDTSFNEIGNIVKGLKVVNDAGERAVRLGADFSEKLVKDESQRQALLQSVELHRRAFSEPTKKELKKDARATLNP